MKPNIIAMQSAIANRSLLTLLLFFICLITLAQPPAKLRPEVYNNFIKPDTRVGVKTISGGQIRETSTAIISSFDVPVDKKKVITYEKDIKLIDASSFERYKPKLTPAITAEDVKIIPELHVEPTGGGSVEPVAYRILFTLERPLQYNAALKKYAAELGFLLMSETGDYTAAIEPVNVEITPGVDPRSFVIDHLSIPSKVVLFTVDKIDDSIAVTVRTTSNPGGYVTYLKVRPSLEVSSNRSVMQGFGIQETPVTVRFTGSNSADSVKVDLSAEKGKFSSDYVYLSYNRSATVYLRSEGLGNSKVSAKSNVADSNELLFKFVFPWLFLLASVFGGLAGSLAKYFLNVKEKGAVWKPIAGGVLIGLMAAVAYFGLGVSLIGISLSVGMHELAVFAISALAAYFGISMIKLDGKK